MGGRGSSSGISDKGRKYGSEYNTVLKSGNIKFVKANSRDSESLFETMTPGRVYVTVGGNDLLRITYYDKKNMRTKQIDLDHAHEKMKPHTHHGYRHKERDSDKGSANLTPDERKMVDRVNRIWYNYLNNKQ